MRVTAVRVDQEDAGYTVIAYGGGGENTLSAKVDTQAQRQWVGAKVAVHQGIDLGRWAWEAGSVAEWLLPAAAERVLRGQEQGIGPSGLGVLP
jgi:hypothetical protein